MFVNQKKEGREIFSGHFGQLCNLAVTVLYIVYVNCIKHAGLFFEQATRQQNIIIAACRSAASAFVLSGFFFFCKTGKNVCKCFFLNFNPILRNLTAFVCSFSVLSSEIWFKYLFALKNEF